MGLRFDLAKESRPSKSRIEVNACSLVYQKLVSRSIFLEGFRRGQDGYVPLVWDLEGIFHVVCLLRHAIHEARPDGLVNTQTKEVGSSICIFLELLL